MGPGPAAGPHDGKITAPMRLQGKTAVITGGGSGIGLATAQAFVREGAKVAIFGRDAAKLQKATGSLGAPAIAITGDAAKLTDLERLFSEVAQQLGKIDIIVANAGLIGQKPFDAITEAEFDAFAGVNFKGVFFTVQKALPHLNDGASIILVSSALAHVGMLGQSLYAATKAAVISLGKTLGAALSNRSIRVNVVSPGPVESGVWTHLPPEAREKQRLGIQNSIPMKRMGTPDEIASAIVFLASAESSYMTGSELVVDGGRLTV
jgi:NAD(P)-dependent dehydrogenase (short-subunit alcohol dehydrogenase family)